MRHVFLVFLVGGVLPIHGIAQSVPQASSELFHPELQVAIERAKQAIAGGAAISDRHVMVVDAGENNVAVAVVAQAEGEPRTSRSHDGFTEVYYVLSGSGVQATGKMTGGTPTAGAMLGSGMRSDNPIQEPKLTRLRTGDIQVIPPGVAHGFTSVDPGGIVYLVFRSDSDHVLGPSPD